VNHFPPQLFSRNMYHWPMSMSDVRVRANHVRIVSILRLCNHTFCPSLHLSTSTTHCTMVDILVIGATGFCGRHAARYVLEHSERSKYTVGLAARSRSKIASIGLPIDESVQIFELDILDKDAVETVVKQAKVVLNCIGPFWHYGTPVVQCVMQVP
jgi:FlaA1/EpsC-like NDP-sugar epimerase